MHREPNKISSGLLTLAVHALFFGVLYYGLSWHSQQPEGMQVELWGSLPQQQVLPAHVAPPPPPSPPVVQPKPAPAEQQLPKKAEIEMQGKKVKSAAKKPIEKPKKQKMSKAQREQAIADMRAMEQLEDKNLASREAQDAQAAKAAKAISSEVEKYMGLISAKIRRHIVMPPDLSNNVTAKFSITLLPDGSLVGDPQMLSSSGSAAYDAAVVRAIVLSQPFPLPPDQAARARFLNPSQIRLKFNSKDEQ